MTDDAIGENAERAVSGIVYHLTKLGKLWGDVLPNTWGGGGGGGGGSGGGGGGGESEEMNTVPSMSAAKRETTVFQRALGALLGVVVCELVKRVEALGGSSGKDNTHEMQHLLHILVDGAPGIFGNDVGLSLDFVPSWSKLVRIASVR